MKNIFFPGIKNKESTKLDIIIFIISINQSEKIFLFFIFKYKEKSGLFGHFGQKPTLLINGGDLTNDYQ